MPGRSDINLMLILDDLSPGKLTALAGPFGAWRKSGYEPPLVIGRPEWARATDVFPIEITDMRAGYEVLRGPDPVADLSVAPADLRRALEREFRGKLLRLRQGYVAAADDPAALGRPGDPECGYPPRAAPGPAHPPGQAGPAGAVGPRRGGGGGGRRGRGAAAPRAAPPGGARLALPA